MKKLSCRLDRGRLIQSIVPLLQERPGVLPHKSDGGARQKILRTPVKGTRILFYGRVLN